MEKYHNGKIYRINCLTSGDYYIGSTIKSLQSRISGHKYGVNRKTKCKSSIIIERNNYEIELIEQYHCDSAEELRKREAYFQRIHKDDVHCLNCKIEDRSLDEWIADHKEYFDSFMKEYYVRNKERIKEQHFEKREEISKYKKKYHEENREHLSRQNKEYKIKNKERLDIKRKEYYINNKEMMDQKQNEKNKKNRELNKIKRDKKNQEQRDNTDLNKVNNKHLHCECGSIIVKYERNKHYNTIKHKAYLESIEILHKLD